MSQRADTTLPQVTLREAWQVSSVQQWAMTMGRRSIAPAAVALRSAGSTATAPATGGPVAGRARRAEALLRLAADERATVFERALAAEHAAAELRRSA